MNGWKQHANHDGVAQRHFTQDGVLLREKVQDVAPTIDQATRVRNDLNGKTPGGMRHLGSVPAVVFDQWVKEWTAKGLIRPGDTARINELAKAKLRERDYAKFRTTDARF